MKTLFQPFRVLTLLLSILTVNLASAQTQIWTNSNGNWSAAVNWSPNGVPGVSTNVLFTNNVAAPNTAGTVDNTVVTSSTIAALQYANFTNTGGVFFYHTTQIAAGQTLTVTNGLTVGTLQDGAGGVTGTNVTVNATITGLGGTLALTGGNLVVNQASAQGGAHYALLNMTKLDTFTAAIGRLQIGVANGVNRAEGALYLARTNIISLSGSAPQLYMGFNNGNNNGSANFPILYLGQANAFFVDSITVSADKQGNPSSKLFFNPVFTNNNPVAYFRGTNGITSRVSSWILGNNNGQTTTGSTSDGTNDFTFGTLDAMVNSMVLGISEKGSGATSGSGFGGFTFTAGTNNVNTLILGQRLCTAGNSVGVGTMNVNGTATLVANSAICLSFWAAGGNTVYGAGYLNINGGSVWANTITNGTPSGGNPGATINVTGGTLGITSLLGFIGTPVNPINTLNLSGSTLQLAVSGIQTNVVVSTLTLGGTTNIINISSVPASVITYPTQFPLIAYGANGGSLSGTFNIGVSNLPGTYQGYISNNTANSSIDLVLTSGPTSISVLDWKGSAGPNWDTASVNWLNGVSPVAYFDGASVQFDDTATGPTAVNLVANVSPASVTVSNNTLPYAFSGSGIIGSTSVTKYGSNTLLFTNSGNAFIGGVTINAGTVQFGAGGTSGVLPGTGNVTDNGNLVFNHSNNETVQNTISGAGTLIKNGGNILTLTASNSFSGMTVVNGGTLLVNGVLSGSLTNAAGSAVGGTGTNFGPINVSGTIQPSAVSGIPTTFTSGDLNLSSGATLKFNLSATDTTAGNNINDLLQVNGNLNANNNVISLNFAGVPQTGVPYTLINYSGSQSGNLSPAVGGTHYSVAINQVSSPVTVTLTGPGANLKWVSTASPVWDFGTTPNWLNGLTPDVFYAGDNVLFDDSVGVVTNVTIGSGVTVYPALITVNSTNNNFSIGGTGKISGQAGIQKYGSSTLTLSSGANDFTNTVQVFAGTLKLGANGAAGKGITYVTNGATLDLNASTMGGSAGVSGTGVGGMGAIVNNGFILNGNQHAFDSGTFVYLLGDTAFGSNNRWDIRNGSLASGDGNPWNLTILGTNDFHLVNATVDSQLGNIDVKGGQFAIETTTIQNSPAWAGDSSHSITVEGNSELSLSPSVASVLGRSISLSNNSTLQNVSGVSTFNGPVILTGSDTISVLTGTLEIDSAIAGSGILIKTGGSPLKLFGANTYTNSTLVNAGSVALNDSSSISSSAYINIAAGAIIDVSARTDTTLTLAGGQTLQGNGAVNINLAVGAGAAISPGADSATIGMLTVSNNVTLGGTTLMKINATTGANDVLASSNTIAYGGILIVTNLSGTPTNGQSFQLFVSTNYDNTTPFSSVILPVATGLTWTNNLAVNGTITAGVTGSGQVAQPHITSVSLSGTGLIISGTNGTAGSSFAVLTSTNVALALTNWTPVVTNTFSGGNFSVTNTVNPNAAQNFYILRVP